MRNLSQQSIEMYWGLRARVKKKSQHQLKLNAGFTTKQFDVFDVRPLSIWQMKSEFQIKKRAAPVLKKSLAKKNNRKPMTRRFYHIHAI